jgi:hypothetical protein
MTFDFDSIARHENILLRKEFELHASKPKGSGRVGCAGSAGVGADYQCPMRRTARRLFTNYLPFSAAC